MTSPGSVVIATTGRFSICSGPGSREVPRWEPGDHEELAGAAVAGSSWIPMFEHRALDRVAAHSAVAVPGQIRQARFCARDLDHDAVAVEAVRCIAQVRASEGSDAAETLVSSEARDERRVLVQVVDSVAPVLAPHRRPPRPLSSGRARARDAASTSVEIALRFRPASTTPLRWTKPALVKKSATSPAPCSSSSRLNRRLRSRGLPVHRPPQEGLPSRRSPGRRMPLVGPAPTLQATRSSSAE